MIYLPKMNLSRILIAWSIGIRFENKVKKGEANRDSKITLCYTKILLSTGISAIIKSLITFVSSNSFGV